MAHTYIHTHTLTNALIMQNSRHPGIRTWQWEQQFLDREHTHIHALWTKEKKEAQTKLNMFIVSYLWRCATALLHREMITGPCLEQARAKVHIPSFPPKTLLWSLLMSHLESWSLCNLVQSSALLLLPFFCTHFDRWCVCRLYRINRSSFKTNHRFLPNHLFLLFFSYST